MPYAFVHVRSYALINRGLRAFVLSCVALLQLKCKICFVCAFQLTIQPRLFPLFHFATWNSFAWFFSFFCFKPLDTLLFTQLFCNNIYVRSKNEGVDIMKTVQLFDFHFIPNCLKGFKVINWKLWKQILWMISICVKIRNLWLIMATYCIFFLKKICVNCNYFAISVKRNKCVKIKCLLS